MMKIRFLVLLIVILLLSACFNGEIQLEKVLDTEWIMETPNFGSDEVEFEDVLNPKKIITVEGKTDIQIEEEIQEALNYGGIIVFDAKEKRTIKLSKQLYIPVQGRADNSWNNDDPIIIDGVNMITLDGNGSTRILEKAWKVRLTVQRINFINANSSNVTSGRENDNKSGGAINVESWDGSLKVIDCDFTNCNAINSGPDIGGGAVRCPGQKQAVFYNCNFIDCSGSNGGSINSLGSELWIIKCDFKNSSATGLGGGAEVGESGQGGIGGAVYIDGISNNSSNAVLRIEESNFINSHSNEHGGAVFIYTYENSGSKVLIKESTFSNNKINGTTGFGGAFYSQNGELKVFSSTFNNNSSASMGGAIWHLSSSISHIANSTFTGNNSINFASAIQLGGPMYISSCTIYDNNCDGPWGGAIRNGKPEEVCLKNCILSNNTCQIDAVGNVSATYQDGGGNYQWPLNENHLKAVEEINFSNPNLGILQDNGGKTLTRMPSKDSLINGTKKDSMIKDQRGKIRNNITAGSVELD